MTLATRPPRKLEFDFDSLFPQISKGENLQLETEIEHHLYNEGLALIGKYSQANISEKSNFGYRILSRLYCALNPLGCNSISTEKSLRVDGFANYHLAHRR